MISSFEAVSCPFISSIFPKATLVVALAPVPKQRILINCPLQSVGPDQKFALGFFCPFGCVSKLLR
jgi:hypothetical protein